VEADPQTKTILRTQTLTPPAHEPGVLPQWLSQMQVSKVIAGGMGQRAQQIFQQKNIEVIVGAPCQTPEELVQSYLNGTLEYGQNVCDH
jgi:predicted Fe-Mo cluster-binding NifX family protein